MSPTLSPLRLLVETLASASPWPPRRPSIPSRPERHCLRRPHIKSLGGCRVSLTLETRALDLVLWALAVEGSRRLHPSRKDCSNTNAEFIEVVKQSVDNMDDVFLINTGFRVKLPSVGGVSKTQQ